MRTPPERSPILGERPTPGFQTRTFRTALPSASPFQISLACRVSRPRHDLPFPTGPRRTARMDGDSAPSRGSRLVKFPMRTEAVIQLNRESVTVWGPGSFYRENKPEVT
eukprot:scaffold1355_cov268-Pinguiococcus_pyrenoidosus.AAC.25